MVDVAIAAPAAASQVPSLKLHHTPHHRRLRIITTQLRSSPYPQILNANLGAGDPQMNDLLFHPKETLAFTSFASFFIFCHTFMIEHLLFELLRLQGCWVLGGEGFRKTSGVGV
jgi:hypothetical protein